MNDIQNNKGMLAIQDALSSIFAVVRIFIVLLIAAFLPYARYRKGSRDQSQLRYACWESQDCLNKHGACMRLALGVEQSQFLQPPNPYLTNSYQPIVNNGISQTIPEREIPEKEIPEREIPEEEKFKAPKPLIEGKGSLADMDEIFG